MIRTALGLPMRPNSWTKAWQGLFASRPTIYISVILVVTLLGYAYQLRTQSIFACPATWYNSDHYIAYCFAGSYADYEHGAFWFDLEPSARAFAKNADVLFVGDSRLQVGFSTAATANWFSAASTRYYLLGFGGFENMVFAEGLLRRIQPKARVYVINVDGFFERSETPAVKTILHDPEARHRYEVKRFWQQSTNRFADTFPKFASMALFGSVHARLGHTRNQRVNGESPSRFPMIRRSIRMWSTAILMPQSLFYRRCPSREVVLS